MEIRELINNCTDELYFGLKEFNELPSTSISELKYNGHRFKDDEIHIDYKLTVIKKEN